MNHLFLPQSKRTLAIDPSTYGLGFALLEDLLLVDWGTRKILGKSSKEKNATAVQRVKALIEQYSPAVVVLEDYEHPESRRRSRARALIRQVAHLAEQRNIRSVRVSLTDVRTYCGGSPDANKRLIALGLVARFPELKNELPPPRKIWMPEDRRTAIFDAVAFGATYVLLEQRKEAA